MRILAVTSDASLITALTSMMRDWEISHVREAVDAKESGVDAAAIIVASGTTERGIETATAVWQSGVIKPCLIIGDSPPPEGTRTRVIVRPFNLAELAEAVTEVAAGPPISPIGDSESSPEPEDEVTVIEELPEEPQQPEEPSSIEAEPEKDAGPELEDAAPLADGAERDPVEEPSLIVSEEPVPAPAEPAPAEPAPAPPAPTPVDLAPLEEPMPSAQAEEVVLPQPSQPIEPPRTPAPAEAPVAVVRPDLAAKEGFRRFLRRGGEREAAKQVAAETQDPMFGRLKAAIIAGSEIQQLLGELPVLAQPRAMAHAFLGEVVEMFGPQIAAVYAANPDGTFSVIAGHGLSSVEANRRVEATQPLFVEITHTLESVLVSPVDLAQGLVAGIGGARTEALLASPLAIAGQCHGIVIVGRRDFTDFDLELLAEQAEEAAPGLAVAQMIDRLRNL